MLTLLAPFWQAILKWGSAAVGILFILFKVRQSGKDSINNKNLETTLKSVQERDEIEDNIKSADDNERNSLREKWTRK